MNDFCCLSFFTLFCFFPQRPHRRNLLRGEGLEGLSDEVGVGGDHLLPAPGLHHVGHVPCVNELDCLKGYGIFQFVPCFSSCYHINYYLGLKFFLYKKCLMNQARPSILQPNSHFSFCVIK